MKSQKRILITVPNLKTGGITTALLNLLEELKNSEFCVDILSFDDDDIDLLPDFVNVIPSNKFMRMLTTSQDVINKESVILGFVRLCLGAVVKTVGQGVAYRIVFSTYKKLKNYDAAISYSQSANRSLHGGCNEFVLQKVDAAKKIGFVHCDFIRSGINTRYSKHIYKRFDIIAAVSNGVKNTIISSYPELKNKVRVVHNCFNFEKIKELSFQDAPDYNKNVINLITVARVSYEKGHLRMVEIFSRLKKQYENFSWHVVGDGNHLERLEEEIKKHKLDNHIKIYGEKKNPYGYMRNSDCLLVPSFHEAAPMVFSEALSLCVPVVTTNTISAYEFIGEGNYGYVCKNDDDILQTLELIMKNPDNLVKNRECIANSYIASNENAIREFYSIINENE